MSYLEKAREVRKKLTIKEKIEYMNGIDYMFTKPLWNHGIRSARMADASMGLRDKKIPATAFPASVALAASWNRSLASEYGKAVAEEFLAAGVDVLLGPGVNMYRVPTCGRNFEYLGEDPFLASEMVVPYIEAAQETGVAATVKHFACNNSDWHRKNWNAIVDERTLREIYFPAFEAAVKKAKVKALMTSYNLVNGEYAGENAWLIKDVLQKDWGFEGLVMSDWHSLFHTDKALKSGLHLDMPGNLAFQQNMVKALLDDGVITENEIDEKVDRILAFVLEAIDVQDAKRGNGKGKCQIHADIALKTAREGIVLLKNKNALLPLKKDSTVSLLGPFVEQTPHSGGGAAHITASSPISIKEGMTRIAPSVKMNLDISGIEKSDVVIICVGFTSEVEGEFKDRPFELPPEQEQLIREVVSKHDKVVVVLTTGGNVDMSAWIGKVSGLVHLWYPGENGSVALAEIFFGDVNPSGKLPISMEKKFSDCAGSANYLPEGESIYAHTELSDNMSPRNNVHYKEGIFTGYRHFDSRGIEPLFPFGFGLSYTTFEYSDLEINGNTVSFTVKNTGKVPGSEIAQLYIAPPKQKVERPQKELKGFDKVFLDPGEKKLISIKLDERSFSYYDIANHDWVAEKGSYKILVGSSSRDIRLEGVFKKD